MSQRSTLIPKAYNPKDVEERIYQFWLDGGYFTPEIQSSKKPFVIIMPLPNVTGELHMGHALTMFLEDLMIRWHRMRGEPALWLPGIDHAGIATQVVVERELAKEGLTRHQLGRERFVERVWDWVGKYRGIIGDQLKRMGTSCDWTREQFTLDEGPSKAVRTTFVNLFKKGLIYRGERIINWCPRCATALSDLEVEHSGESANLYYIRYPFEDGSGAITVATTRPETLLGDMAVAVNPSDERYQALEGQKVVLPVLKRLIPIITDPAVAPEFGTGALKVTPGHDPVDFDMGQRHNLSIVNVINLDGTMNENAGPYQGRDRFECRKKIVEQLRQEGLLEKTEPYHHSLGHCQRCNSVVEPLVSKQWFIKMEPLAKPAIDAVTSGRVKIIPERFIKVYLNWMKNLRDWCISRQLWWGHRIPVWYCQDCDEITVDYLDPTACSHCASANIHQDPDVLDTWFSSALWPHSTLGWPDKTQDLDYFYPTGVMETGYDILFFWVARMIMIGLENMGTIPFHTVYLHGLIRDVEGVKMSKTRGNVADPLQAIDDYGTDALRFALTTGNSPGNDQRFSSGKLEASRNFANKLWNAARFVTLSLDGATGLEGWSRPSSSHRHDRWILSRLNEVVQRVQQLMEEYQFGEAQRELHDFLWSEYCDWYIEMAKIRLRSPAEGQPPPLPVLAHVLEKVLRLLHPFMPFITEEIWQNLMEYLPREADLPEALIVAPYPESDSSFLDDEAEEQMELVIAITRAIRNLRAELRIEAPRRIEATVEAPQARLPIEEETAVIENLARVQPLRIASEGELASSDNGVTLVLGKASVFLPLEGVVDVERERQRLEKEREGCLQNIDRLSSRLKDKQFLEKAPEDVVERERQRLTDLEERQSRIQEVLAQIGE